MTGIKKVLIVLAALAAVFGFVACSDNDDDDGGSGGGGSSSSGNVVAVYVWEEENGNKDTITFFSDKTFSDVTSQGEKSQTVAEGKYEGDPTKDGNISLTATKVVDDDGKLQDTNQKSDGTIKDGVLDLGGGYTYTRQ